MRTRELLLVDVDVTLSALLISFFELIEECVIAISVPVLIPLRLVWLSAAQCMASLLL